LPDLAIRHFQRFVLQCTSLAFSISHGSGLFVFDSFLHFCCDFSDDGLFLTLLERLRAFLDFVADLFRTNFRRDLQISNSHSIHSSFAVDALLLAV
jgi:hypothetical protein